MVVPSHSKLFASVKTVSQITRRLEDDLSQNFRNVAVRGEISNFRQAASGHFYFVLKDAKAQLRAVMFRGQTLGLKILPADGLEVEVLGDITLYAPRGDLQIIVQRLKPSGRGALMEAFTRLKESLQEEGLFDADRKVPLPPFPQMIALITSPTGAAVRDMIHVLRRRWPPIRLALVPVRVQGAGSAAAIAEGIRLVNHWGNADLMIVGRGGGSLEDLWAFNEECVVRSIAESGTPVVSAVGHETDTVLADFAADVRAATPSAGAELVVPDYREIAGGIQRSRRKLLHFGTNAVVSRRENLRRIEQAYGFRRPKEFLQGEQLNLDRLSDRLRRGVQAAASGSDTQLKLLHARLGTQHPRRQLESAHTRFRAAASALEAFLKRELAESAQFVAGMERALKSLDPSRVLGRGYAWVRHPGGTSVQSAQDLAEEAIIQFASDRAQVRVLRKERRGPFDPLEEEL